MPPLSSRACSALVHLCPFVRSVLPKWQVWGPFSSLAYKPSLLKTFLWVSMASRGVHVSCLKVKFQCFSLLRLKINSPFSHFSWAQIPQGCPAAWLSRSFLSPIATSPSSLLLSHSSSTFSFFFFWNYSMHSVCLTTVNRCFELQYKLVYSVCFLTRF